MRKKRDTRSQVPNTGAEEVPPGATRQAFDRPENPGGGAPGSGAGPRHAANDEGTPDETYGATDSNNPLADPTLEEEETPENEVPAYSGPTGGAVGGTPAQGRSTGGRGGGFAPDHGGHGDSTIGRDPGKKRRR
jgi:hypothetical protein